MTETQTQETISTFPPCPPWCQDKGKPGHLAGDDDGKRPDGVVERAHSGSSWSMPGRGVGVSWGGETTEGGGLRLSITVDPTPGHELTPDDARKLAYNLLAAAHEVERAQR